MFPDSEVIDDSDTNLSGFVVSDSDVIYVSSGDEELDPIEIIDTLRRRHPIINISSSDDEDLTEEEIQCLIQSKLYNEEANLPKEDRTGYQQLDDFIIYLKKMNV
jgi:hypothetical protein